MIFVDSNVPMYLIGKPHPNRDKLSEFIRAHTAEIYVTSAEIFQEIIHRYVAINRREAIEDGFTLLESMAHHVYPVTLADTKRAHTIALQQHRLSGRDCLHVAVMERFSLTRILTCDENFDYWTSIERLP